MILYQVLFIYLLFIKQPFLEVNHFLQTLTKCSAAGSSVHCLLQIKTLKQDWKKSALQLHIGHQQQGLGSRGLQRCPVWQAALRWPQPVPDASETSINSPSTPKTSGRFKRGLSMPVPATRDRTRSTGNVAGNTLWAGGTAAMGDPCWGSNTPKGLQLWGTHARVAAPPRALWPVDASLEQDMKKENSGKNSKIKRSKNIPLWHMTPPPALLFTSPITVRNTERNTNWK